jgi:circadian clock protein KaiC
LTTVFIGRGASEDDKCLLFAFEESRDQLIRNAAGWGVDFESMEKAGRLRVVAEYPELRGLEDHFVAMQEEIDAFEPTRIAVDSLSALERVSTQKGFREFVIGLTSLIKDREVVGLLTATTPSLVGGASVTEAHISTITDTIILLRYVEMFGEMRRGVTVLKMRGSMHEKAIREFQIDGDGMHIGDPFRNVTGILTGQPMYAPNQEMERIGSLFASERSDPPTPQAR